MDLSITLKIELTFCSISAIKNALKEENLNPEIEEKLLELQRYQEQQMKQDKMEVPVIPQVAPTVTAKVPAKKRPSPTASHVVNQQQGVSVKEDWESTPKRKVAKIDTKDVK
jgi:nucleosome-remodeling factor subunit BPTF